MKILPLIIASLLSFMFVPLTAATTINFEELPRFAAGDECPPASGEYECEPYEVEGFYSGLGVSFVGAGTAGLSGLATSGAKGISDVYGPSMAILFDDNARPDYVSFFVSALLKDVVFISAHNDSGQLIAETESKGWGGTEPDFGFA